jgi:hypothetical protein
MVYHHLGESYAYHGCCQYCTKKDSYALPRIEELLDSLSGSTYFATVDMKSGYHQVEILEQHKERTAFTVGPLGFYEFNRMPFGLTISPSTYQRIMEACSPLPWFLLVFLGFL